MDTIDPLRVTVDDGHEYRMQSESVTAKRDWERDESNIAYGIRRARSGDDIFVVSLAGEHDLYTAPKVQEELRSASAAGARVTIVDLTETMFLDSTMLTVLLRARKELPDGGRLLLVTNDATTRRVFKIAGVDRFFDFYPSRRAAEERCDPRDHDERASPGQREPDTSRWLRRRPTSPLQRSDGLP